MLSRYREGALGGLIGLVVLTATPSAGAATLVGETFTPTQGCGTDVVFIQTISPGGQYTVPFAGVLTSWSFRAAGTAPDVKLKVVRPAGGNDFTTIGEGTLETPTVNSLNTYPTQIPVQPGDVIGIYVTNGFCSRVPAPGYARHLGPDVPPGSTATYSTFAGVQFDIAATLEPDCDSDGFGDETQDTDLSPCPPAPETTITKHPKDKTKKKQATFEFTANEPGATFECSLDGKPFAPCASPDTFKVKKGKHNFAVRAKDAGNNVEESPATDDWKVKKGKKK